MFENKLKAVVLAGALSFAAAGANAASFTFDENSGGIDLDATVTFLLVGDEGDSIDIGEADDYLIGVDEYVYEVVVSNLTAPQDGDNSLTAFGINVNPDGVTSGPLNTSDVFSFAGSSGNLGQGLGSFELCYEVDNNNNCVGNNPSNALGEGESDTFFLSFISDDALSFINAFVRFQEVGGGGSEKTGSSPCEEGQFGNDCDESTSPIPLPAGLPLMLTVVGVGAYMRRRARKSA